MKNIFRRNSKSCQPRPFLSRLDSATYQVPPLVWVSVLSLDFIHWGLYSLPAFGELSTLEHVHPGYGRIWPYQNPAYKDFWLRIYPLFTAENFMHRMAVLFKEVSPIYFPVAEHLYFQLYDSQLFSFNSVEMGPKISGELRSGSSKSSSFLYFLPSGGASFFLSHGKLSLPTPAKSVARNSIGRLCQSQTTMICLVSLIQEFLGWLAPGPVSWFETPAWSLCTLTGGFSMQLLKSI